MFYWSVFHSYHQYRIVLISVAQNKSSSVSPITLLFFFKTVLAILDPLLSHVNFKSVSHFSPKGLQKFCEGIRQGCSVGQVLRRDRNIISGKGYYFLLLSLLTRANLQLSAVVQSKILLWGEMHVWLCR